MLPHSMTPPLVIRFECNIRIVCKSLCFSFLLFTCVSVAMFSVLLQRQLEQAKASRIDVPGSTYKTRRDSAGILYEAKKLTKSALQNIDATGLLSDSELLAKA